VDFVVPCLSQQERFISPGTVSTSGGHDENVCRNVFLTTETLGEINQKEIYQC
jgi:hypothetical protein